jgi:predicted transposase YbfD/YdcC
MTRAMSGGSSIHWRRFCSWDKSNELTAIPMLLARLAQGDRLHGALVSIDAIATNGTIAESIRKVGAGWLLAVKANQPTLRADIEACFDAAPAGSIDTHTEHDKSHGRIEQRDIDVIREVDWLSGDRRFPGELRWPPKTGQAAKRESSLGTAGWPEVRHVEYTEEAQSRVQGEGGTCGDPRGRHGSRVVEQVWGPCQPDPCVEEDAAGRDCGAVWTGQAIGEQRRCGGGSTGTFIREDRPADGGAGFFAEKVRARLAKVPAAKPLECQTRA